MKKVMALVAALMFVACMAPCLAIAEDADGKGGLPQEAEASLLETPQMQSAQTSDALVEEGSSLQVQAAYPDMPEYKRVAGSNRYETSSQLATQYSGYGMFNYGRVVVATGKNFPDALAAASLAGAYKCPIVLTNGKSITSENTLIIRQYASNEAIILGGTASVSSSVEQTIKNLGIKTRRIAGGNRYATSLKVYDAFRAAKGGACYNTVIIATGSNFADALAISPYSYAKGAPIVLASGGKLTLDAAKRIKSDKCVRNIVIVGGTSVVKDTVKSQLGPGFSYTRLSGGTRYETAKAIANWELKHGMNLDYPAIATGSNFPDALVGSFSCGLDGSILLLADNGNLSALSVLKGKSSAVDEVAVLGGEKAVSQQVVGYARSMLYTGTKANARSYYKACAAEVRDYKPNDWRWGGSSFEMIQIGNENYYAQAALMDEIIGYAKSGLSVSAAKKLDSEQEAWEKRRDANAHNEVAKEQAMNSYASLVYLGSLLEQNDVRIDSLINRYF